MSNLFGGKNFEYLIHRHRTKRQLKSTGSRFNRDLNKLKDPYECGIFSRPQDLAYERPSKTDPENIFLYAANGDDEIITLHLHWTPNPDENCGLIRVNLKLIGFQNGVTYQYKRSQIIYNLDKFDDYSVGGFKLEIFFPLKRIKLRLNDFCLSVKENTDQEQTYDQNDYKYIRLIAIVLPVQEVYDHLTTFDSKFVSSQLTSLSQRFPKIDLVDIGTHVKFYAQIDGQSAVETDLWGFRGKLRLPQVKPNQLIKFSGYALKKGYNFSVSFFEIDGSWFVNGFAGWGAARIFPIVATTATKDLFIKDNFSFTIENKYKKFNVTGNKRANAIYSIKIDNCTGVGLYIKLPFTGNEPVFDSKVVDFGPLVGSIPSIEKVNDLIVALNQTLAINSQLTGGKGSSLSKLSSILVDHPQLGQVPLGIVVTTKAYHLMSQTIDLASMVDKLKHKISSSYQDMVQLEAECCSLVDKIVSFNLPEPIREAINSSLTESFGSNWINDKKFAIRSSACGEDSDELSCAGQMETFLGISNLDQIFKCVMKCWASQFRFIAIRYKLMNGLDLNLDMAVVIQEIIDCDQAGVLFTCDPVASDPLSVLITANHGLGESIVSSISDPDTIKVKLEMSPNGLTIDSIEDIQIGGKGRIIKLSDTGEGTITIDSQSKSSSCCLNENQILSLTTTCLKVASFFNGPCDIEWGIQSDQIYLFQCRPVTTFSSSVDLIDWELNHELDSSHVSSNEYHTRANLGEVYPGATSYICNDYQIPSSTIAFVKKFFINRKSFKFMPYVSRGFIVNSHHCFFSMKDGALFVYDTPPEKENVVSTSMEYSLLGQVLDDREMKTDSYERLSQFLPQSKWQKLKSTADIVFMGSKRLAAVTLDEFPSKVTEKSSSHEMFLEIVNNSDYLWDIFLAHLSVTIGSSVMNFLAISILTRNDKNSPSILPDFSKLLASCEQVVSAQIPVIIKELASKVTDEEERKLILNGTPKEISDYLNTGTSQLATNYRNFIKDYGHRGWKEFDWSGKVWRKDPSFIINPLKVLIQQSDFKSANPGQAAMNDEELIASLKTPLSKISKFLLKRFILPWCRNYVSLREEGKNKLVWKIDQMRKLFDQMVNTLAYKEFRLPDPSLAYYLTPDEFLRLTLSSNPGLVLLAKRRQKICQKLDSYEFPIINIGPKILPNNLPIEQIYIKDWSNYNGQEIIGTPISQGQIKSTAYVARKIEEAANIKPGDILITYSTDVGWCPFFPLIGGLITEIGGLISHGAVIAREFGLPCIVGVPNACKIFKSGDKISMDASKGVIVKLID